MPDFRHEAQMGGVIAGIDEAGRGPWAGPVVAAAVVLDPARLPPRLPGELDDSKKLQRERRRELFEALTACAHIGVGQATVAEIDSHNILAATMVAMARAFQALDVPADAALVDGNRCPDLGRPARCLVGGDRLSLSVAAASIVAKVTRDRLMSELARTFPGYGWERNAGYGTAEHRQALHRLGVTPHHRKSFAPIANILRSVGQLDSISCPAKPLTY
jgi:ribonuclease HII